MSLLPPTLLPSLTTMFPGGRIPTEEFAKEEKSQVWLVDCSANFAGTPMGLRDSGERKRSQGAEPGIAHTICFPWKEREPERQALTMSR